MKSSGPNIHRSDTEIELRPIKEFSYNLTQYILLTCTTICGQWYKLHPRNFFTARKPNYLKGLTDVIKYMKGLNQILREHTDFNVRH